MRPSAVVALDRGAVEGHLVIVFAIDAQLFVMRDHQGKFDNGFVGRFQNHPLTVLYSRDDARSLTSSGTSSKKGYKQ